jgi:steroid delta-isomerase-like uncharacterized protein
MSEANVALFRRWFEEVWNQGRRETITELFAADGVAHGVSDTGGDIHGPEEFLPFYDRLVAAFPDMHLEVEDCFSCGDKVVGRYVASMSRTGDYLGLRASGKKARATGISIIRVANGKFVESWDMWDKLSLLQAIGGIQFTAQGAAL